MRLIILDGLDEIVEHRTQAKVLEVISNILVRHHIPLIFLVASRPEQQISFSFDSTSIAPLVDRLRLDHTFNPDDDIQLFLDDSLSAIKATHPRKNFIPESWPTIKVLNTFGSQSIRSIHLCVYGCQICSFHPTQTYGSAGDCLGTSSSAP